MEAVAEAATLDSALELSAGAPADLPPPMDVPAPPGFGPPSPTPTPAAAAPGVEEAVPAGVDLAFLVDTSGSMVDSMPQVRRWLREAIGRLDPAQRFTVIKLGSDGPEAAFPAPRAADAAARSDALAWAERALAEPYGRAEPRAGIELAASQGVGRVVVLADDTFGGRAARANAAAAAEELLAAAGEGTEVFAIQFNYPAPDGLLARLGGRERGGYVFVESVNDLDPDFDASIFLP